MRLVVAQALVRAPLRAGDDRRRRPVEALRRRELGSAQIEEIACRVRARAEIAARPRRPHRAPGASCSAARRDTRRDLRGIFSCDTGSPERSVADRSVAPARFASRATTVATSLPVHAASAPPSRAMCYEQRCRAVRPTRRGDRRHTAARRAQRHRQRGRRDHRRAARPRGRARRSFPTRSACARERCAPTCRRTRASFRGPHARCCDRGRASDVPRIDRWLRPAAVVHATNYLAPPSRLPTLVSVYDCSFVRYPELCTPEVRALVPLVRRAIAARRDRAHELGVRRRRDRRAVRARARAAPAGSS